MISQEYILDINNWKIEESILKSYSYYIYLIKNENSLVIPIGFITTGGKFETRSIDVMQIPKELHVEFGNKNNYYYKTKKEAELALQSFLEKIQQKVFKKEDLDLLR